MKFKVDDRSKGKSPYVRKNKTPYPYHHKRCDHSRKNWVKQVLPLWVGLVCGNCNIIIKNFSDESTS